MTVNKKTTTTVWDDEEEEAEDTEGRIDNEFETDSEAEDDE